ncbi:MAG TPA: hypothetical protein DCE31_02200 [Lautropia sp.]|jgi:malonyl-CoA O-methyltransferase|nr:hypothetical protein [Lautropia sp.]
MNNHPGLRLQHQRRHRRAMDAGFLWDEVQARMLDRMQWVKQSPQQILVLGDANLRDAKGLQTAYPGCEIAVLDWAWAAKSSSPSGSNSPDGTITPQAPYILQEPFNAQGPFTPSIAPGPGFAKRLWSRLLARTTRPCDAARPAGEIRLAGGLKPDPNHPRLPALLQVAADVHQLPLRAGCFDLLWSNGLLHWSRHWPDLLGELHRCARPEALFSFSLLGVDSFSALRSLVPDLMAFPDMHDLGDALVHAGWAEPVVDMDRIAMTWREPTDLLRDLRALGGHSYPGRARHLRSHRWLAEVQGALEAMRREDGLLHLDVELILGHAWRAADRHAAADWQPIQLKLKTNETPHWRKS